MDHVEDRKNSAPEKWKYVQENVVDFIREPGTVVTTSLTHIRLVFGGTVRRKKWKYVQENVAYFIREPGTVVTTSLTRILVFVRHELVSGCDMDNLQSHCNLSHFIV